MRPKRFRYSPLSGSPLVVGLTARSSGRITAGHGCSAQGRAGRAGWSPGTYSPDSVRAYLLVALASLQLRPLLTPPGQRLGVAAERASVIERAKASDLLDGALLQYAPIGV